MKNKGKTMVLGQKGGGSYDAYEKVALPEPTVFDNPARLDAFLDAVLAAVAKGIKKDGLVQLIGFGTFNVKIQAEHKARHSSTGELIKIKASKTVTFKRGASLKAIAKKAKPASLSAPQNSRSN